MTRWSAFWATGEDKFGAKVQLHATPQCRRMERLLSLSRQWQCSVCRASEQVPIRGKTMSCAVPALLPALRGQDRMMS